MRSGVNECIAYFCHSFFLSSKGYAVKIVKYNRAFKNILAELEESQWYPPERLQDLQNIKLRRLIKHAYENVPYYNRQFKRHGLSPDNIKCTDDLKKLPLLTKDTLREQPDDFIAKNISKKYLVSGWTTGTSGTPVNALRSRESITFENAVLWRQKKWAGINIGCRKAAVWGSIWNNIIVPASCRRPPFWRRNISDNQMLFSYYHISDETLPLYFRKLEEFKPEYIEGFPSTILTLASFLKKQGMFFPVKAVFTSSEPLYDIHRKEIEECFRTRVFDHYGQAERVVAASDCSEHKGLHVHPEYGVLELIKNNTPVPCGECGEIVGTGLNNYAMPLIRYRTGDTARISNLPCPCGRNLPLLQSIDGRSADSIITPHGRIIPGNGLMAAFHGIENIKKSQLVQEEIGRITVKIEKNSHNDDVDIKQLKLNLARCLGDETRVTVDIVDSIERGNSIKYRWVISEVKKDD
jgi:phenylacetate-CoA ligase